MDVKGEFKRFCVTYSTPEEVNDKESYYRVKKWVRKAVRSYVIHGVFALFLTFAVCALLDVGTSLGGASVPVVLVFPLYLAVFLLAVWGHASMRLYKGTIFKSVMKSGVSGYRAGEQVESTHYEIKHEYGDRYRVTSHTENKGCLFALIGGGGKYLLWAAFFVYAGSFLTFKKIKASRKKLEDYETQQGVA